MLFDFDIRLTVYCIVLHWDHRLLLQRREWANRGFLGLPADVMGFGDRLESLVARVLQPSASLLRHDCCTCIAVRKSHPETGCNLLWGSAQKLATFCIMRVSNPTIGRICGGVWWDIDQPNPYPDDTFEVLKASGELNRMHALH